MTVKAGNESEEREVMEQIERAGQSLGGRAGAGQGKDPAEEIIERAPGDDVIVAVRMRRSSFEKLTSSDDGHSVPVTAGMIGLVRDAPAKFNDHRLSPDIWTFLVWSSDPVWRGVPEQIPGNALAAAALADAREARRARRQRGRTTATSSTSTTRTPTTTSTTGST